MLYVAVPFTDGARRETVSLIGADTNHNRPSHRRQHQHRSQRSPRTCSAAADVELRAGAQPRAEPAARPQLRRNLPAGDQDHDVLALFGSNTNDYNEVDVAEIQNPFYLLFLPLNELVTRQGTYDLRRTPDLSGALFHRLAHRHGADCRLGQRDAAALRIAVDAARYGKGKALFLPAVARCRST